MNILAFSDIHTDEDALDRLKALSAKKEYDAVFVCGDIADRGNISFAQDVLSIFKNTYAVFGNNDDESIMEKMEEMGVLVHAKKIPFGKYNIVGVGGSNPTPFNTPTEYSEEQIYSFLQNVDKNSLVISHPPPYGFFDQIESQNIGSKAVRRIIEERQPVLVVCGHVHETSGVANLGKTKIIKIAPVSKLNAVEITINGEIKTNFINL